MNEMFVRSVKLTENDGSVYPFSIPAVAAIESIDFSASPLTFLVGENGSGKSTIIEAVAIAAGFNAEGGTKNYNYSTLDTTSSLAEHVALVRGARREKAGYFLRAESFYTTANYADVGTFPDKDEHARPLYFGGRRIHEQSHGEAFLAIVKDFRPGLYIFDEPESALSPNRQLSLLMLMQQLVEAGSQFIIATHSPILLAYTGAAIYELSDQGVNKASYDELDHVKVTKDFLNNPSLYMRHMLRGNEG